jgi:aspartate ammonia-lyase
LEKSIALATLLVPYTGYDKAAAVARKAYETGMTVKEIAVEEKLISEELLIKLLKQTKTGG